MRKKAKTSEIKKKTVANWDAFALETVADVRLILAFIMRKMLKRELDVNTGKAAADVARAILKTHELERAVPDAAVAGLARLMATIGKEMVSSPGEGVASPTGREVQGEPDAVPDGSRWPEKLQDGDREAESCHIGVAE